MQFYAHIVDGIVREIVSPIEGFTLAQCFSADFVESCIACDVSVQQGWLFTAPSSFMPQSPRKPSLADQATAALVAGCRIVSTSMPSISGTYPCDATAQARLAATTTFINTNGKFPGSNSASIAWMDMAMQPHVFTTTEGFLEFASAIANYVAHLYEANFGQVTTLPVQPLTIS
ncbi:MAG TPA: hypothetical protein VM689_20555 [Aliidongia sp.]|nr:hypothetical protein [Aliidongia sp.]